MHVQNEDQGLPDVWAGNVLEEEHEQVRREWNKANKERGRKGERGETGGSDTVAGASLVGLAKKM